MNYRLIARSSGRKVMSSTRMRKLRANWRDTVVLLREFGWPLLLFALAMVGGGLLYFSLARSSGQPLSGRVEAIYLVLSLTFLQSLGEFPDIWTLQLFYFVMPLIGIGILAQGLADFGILFFNRRARGKEWEMAVASTYNNHIVLIGLGHLGFRVLTQLQQLGKDVVVIEIEGRAELVTQARDMSTTVLQDDGSHLPALEAAGVARARTIVVCTQNDSLNLQIAFKARKLNPDIKVILRIFDFDFASALEEQFGFRALSATGMSAPIFAAAAAEVDITQPITVEGKALSLASVTLGANCRILDSTLTDVEQTYGVSVVLLRRNHTSEFHPNGDHCLVDGDVMAVLGGQDDIRRLVNDVQRVN